MNPRKRSTNARSALRAAAVAEDTGSQAHDEWLLDEALMETFPASDATAPAIVSIPSVIQRPRSRAAAVFPA